MLSELFQVAPQAQSVIVGRLCDRVIRNLNPLPSILLLRRLVEHNAGAFSQHRQQVVECIDHLLNLPA